MLHYPSKSTNSARMGRPSPTEVVSKAAFDEEGNLLIIGASRDITERKRVEESLRVSNDTNQAIFNATLESIILIDRNGMIQSVNRTGAERMGSTPAALIGKNLFTLLSDDVAAKQMVQAAGAAPDRHAVIF